MAISPAIIAIAPQLIDVLTSVVKGMKTETAPSPVETVRHPSEAIRHLQALMNRALKPNPPLQEDGWLGPRTEEAIDKAIALLQAAGIGR